MKYTFIGLANEYKIKSKKVCFKHCWGLWLLREARTYA